MFLLNSFLLTIFFLLGTFFSTAIINAFRALQSADSKKQLSASGNWFFYRPCHLYFFPEHEYEKIFFSAVCTQNLARCCYAASAVFFLLFTPLLYDVYHFWIIVLFSLFLLLSVVIGDYLPRILSIRAPEKMLRICLPCVSLYMLLAFPFTYLLLKISQFFSKNIYFDASYEPEAQTRQEIIDIIQEAELTPGIDRHDKKLFESVLSFRERIAREVMVPRVDLFSLPADTSIKEAAELIAAEGYSRIPIYRNTVDEIIGVVMYKDLLAKFREYVANGNASDILQAPIETIQKAVLYTPETKKISNLLQEFRKKQVHLAIVVDEYGGTEGIVTIEDILEEIVGEIADEYDTEEKMFVAQQDGSWIVDARLNIFDADEQFGIDIPQEADYDTIGGYVFHCAGTIPSKGFTIHQDEFEMEVIDSNERVVEKVRIKPLKKNRNT